MRAKDWWALAFVSLLLFAICGQAMRVSGDDNACATVGGHLEGFFGVECVKP
jgi:hypothetical protein